MIVGHLPASYLATWGLRRWLGAKAPIWVGLAGGLFPDIDMLYFYLVDHRRHLHHSYWTHLPAFWLGLWVVSLGVTAARPLARLRPAVHLFFANVLLHLVLDSICGGIRWLYPLSRRSFALVEVEARFGWWVASFVLHPTFILEIAVIIAAVELLVSGRARRLTHGPTAGRAV